jgi:hypothetical protein
VRAADDGGVRKEEAIRMMENEESRDTTTNIKRRG